MMKLIRKPRLALPRLALVVALSENNVIGRNGELPWRLPTDLQRFKRLTMGHCMVMGRKTFDSIGRPLPGRVTIVLSRAEMISSPPKLLAAKSLDEALRYVPMTEMKHDQVFVTGGAEIYKLTLPQADRMYVTRVHADVEGDTFFPELDWTEWQAVESEETPADERHELASTFTIYERIGS